jgi:hypothetical protein
LPWHSGNQYHMQVCQAVLAAWLSRISKHLKLNSNRLQAAGKKFLQKIKLYKIGQISQWRHEKCPPRHVVLTQSVLREVRSLFHRVRYSASSFKFQYIVFSLMSSSGCLRFLPRLPVTSVLPSIFPSITCFRRQFLRKMWPIHLAFLLFIVCRIFFFWKGPRSRSYGRTAALKLIVQPLWWRWRERWSVFFSFFQVIEHRWNEIDRGKPKYSENRVPVPLCSPQIPHGPTRDRTRASDVGGRRLTAWAVALPQ